MRDCIEVYGFVIPMMGSFNEDDDRKAARIDAGSVRDARSLGSHRRRVRVLHQPRDSRRDRLAERSVEQRWHASGKLHAGLRDGFELRGRRRGCACREAGKHQSRWHRDSAKGALMPTFTRRDRSSGRMPTLGQSGKPCRQPMVEVRRARLRARKRPRQRGAAGLIFSSIRRVAPRWGREYR
jgi:hypothetical protein